jgi:uncharacterized protein YggL (DUF469 family)
MVSISLHFLEKSAQKNALEKQGSQKTRWKDKVRTQRVGKTRFAHNSPIASN